MQEDGQLDQQQMPEEQMDHVEPEMHQPEEMEMPPENDQQIV